MTALMSLGQFVFGLATLAPEQSSRSTTWRYGSGPRVGARPSSQYLGPDTDGVSLQGVLFPELIGDLGGLAALRAMGDAGESFPLLDGGGRVLGDYVIERVQEERRILFPNGEPQKVEFTLDLRRVDDAGDGTGGATGDGGDDGYFFSPDFQDGDPEDVGFEDGETPDVGFLG